MDYKNNKLQELTDNYIEPNDKYYKLVEEFYNRENEDISENEF